MIKLNQNVKINYKTLSITLIVLNSFILLLPDGVEAGDKGDDIILTKGKLIMRGGKDKGNLILDTGSKSSDHHEPMMPMMPYMGHHFNPYSFYPMQQQHHQPAMMIRPIYMEDHSAMHHHQPEYHHEEPHYEHHEMQYSHHSQQHHEPEHHEMQHEPMYHHEMNHHEPEGHHEMEGHQHGGYESHPMMSMMMHGSGLQPTYQHMMAMQAAQQPANYALQLQAQSFPADQQAELRQQQQQQLQQQQQQQQVQEQSQQPQQQASESQNKKVSLLDQASNNPLAAIIRPLFNRSTNKQKKP